MGMLAQQRPSKKGPADRVLILSSQVIVVAKLTAGGWKAYIGVVAGRNHEDEWRDVVKYGSTLSEQPARALFPEFKGEDYDR